MSAMTYLPSLPGDAVLLDVFRVYPGTSRPLLAYHQGAAARAVPADGGRTGTDRRVCVRAERLPLLPRCAHGGRGGVRDTRGHPGRAARGHRPRPRRGADEAPPPLLP